MFSWRRRISSLVLLTTLLGTSWAATAQRLEDTADSPLWWTLTDDLTSEELRLILSDEKLHNERFRQAVASGHRDPLPEKRVAAVKSFLDGSQTPELIPLWQAFNALSLRFHGERREARLEEYRRKLSARELSEESTTAIITYAIRLLDESQEESRRLDPEAQAFVQIARDAMKNMAKPSFDKALVERDAELLAEMAGREPALVAKLMHSWEKPILETHAAINLRLLRAEIPDMEWERFRSFLFQEIAPQISTINFSD